MLNYNSIIDETTPMEFNLSQNYPNPFKEKTAIKYCVPYKTKVHLTVYNSEGKEIIELVDEEKSPGTYKVEFNTVETHRDKSLQSETYYYRLEAGDYKCEKKMQIIK
ncbi:MAG: hypothetical protein EHM47_15750 [Ignavibacteriales bacterium]|nr:MAG: hypothetical protein EHM47_15750 [Ignavibacteriales bacterium]